MSGFSPLRVLVVGQTPPPYGGQAIMVEAFLGAEYKLLKLFHVRLSYSEDMDSVGKFALRKVFVLFSTVLQVWWARVWHQASILYYPPSGPNKVPVLRDIVFLCATRWMFRHTVFHYHAGGVSGYEDELPAVLRQFFRLAYRNADLAIRTAPQNPEDGRLLGARVDVVVANGIPDMRGTVKESVAERAETLTILFTGVLIPSKGVYVLLEAFRTLVHRGADIRLELMGRWGDVKFQAECATFIECHNLMHRYEYLGVKRDKEKLEHFAQCDIFCFPSYFEAESFGLVLLEAMQFAKPVVSTWWRGIPSVVEDGVNGYLVPVQDPDAVADRLMELIQDTELRRRMGDEGRRIFAARFTLERFRQNMEAAIVSAIRPEEN